MLGRDDKDGAWNLSWTRETRKKENRKVEKSMDRRTQCYQNKGVRNNEWEMWCYCHGGGCLLQVEIFLHLRGNTEACHCLVHVPKLVEDKRWNQDKWSLRKLLDSAGSPNKSALTDLH